MNRTALNPERRTVGILCPTWVGDTVMATPVYRAVRAALPNAKLHAIVQRTLAPLLDGAPWFDAVTVAQSKTVASPWLDARQVRALKLEAILLLPNSFRSALTARLAGVPRRIGYGRDGRGWLLSDAVPPPDRSQPMSAVDYYAELAQRALNQPLDDRTLELHVTDEQARAANRLLERVGGAFVILNPGANKLNKRWPADRFAAVADALFNRHSLKSVVTGGPNEVELAEQVLSHCRSDALINLVWSNLDLGSLKGVIQRARLMITNDTGPRHIAAAMRLPTVALFGPTDHRWTTLHGARERIVIAEPFLPEHLAADQHPKACAIEKITVHDVLANAEALLAAHDD